MTLTPTNPTRFARRLSTFATTAGLIVTTTLLTGCSSSKEANDVSFDAVSSDLTPNIAGSFQRPIEIDADLALTNNMNWRLFSDDLGRTFYTDHPSRLSPMPVLYTSGTPR